MQITINVPTPVVRTVATAQFFAINAPTLIKDNAHYYKFKRAQKKVAKRKAKEQAKYDAYIAEAQAHIAETTLVPGFTTVYA